MTEGMKAMIEAGEALQEGFREGVDSQIKVTPKDVIRFNKSLLKRAKINLNTAKNRRDIKAVANIQRKIAIYRYVIGMAEYYDSQGREISKSIEEVGIPGA